MTPAVLAAVHSACFTVPRPWTAGEIAAFLEDRLCFLCAETGGFALGRAVVDEAELLTIAVLPELRRRGLGHRLIGGFMAQARARGAEAAFLEVAANNDAAIALYRSQGFVQSGRRRGYYGAGDAEVDALLFRADLRTGNPDSTVRQVS